MKINFKKLTILNLGPIGLLLKRRKHKLFHYFLPKKKCLVIFLIYYFIVFINRQQAFKAEMGFTFRVVYKIIH